MDKYEEKCGKTFLLFDDKHFILGNMNSEYDVDDPDNTKNSNIEVDINKKCFCLLYCIKLADPCSTSLGVNLYYLNIFKTYLYSYLLNIIKPKKIGQSISGE